MEAPSCECTAATPFPLHWCAIEPHPTNFTDLDVEKVIALPMPWKASMVFVAIPISKVASLGVEHVLRQLALRNMDICCSEDEKTEEDVNAALKTYLASVPSRRLHSCEGCQDSHARVAAFQYLERQTERALETEVEEACRKRRRLVDAAVEKMEVKAEARQVLEDKRLQKARLRQVERDAVALARRAEKDAAYKVIRGGGLPGRPNKPM